MVIKKGGNALFFAASFFIPILEEMTLCRGSLSMSWTFFDITPPFRKQNKPGAKRPMEIPSNEGRGNGRKDAGPV
jgi:hypothetical protein